MVGFSAIQGLCSSLGWQRLPEELFLNPHLLEQPDREDPAVCFVLVSGADFRGLLRQPRRACGCR
jgi:hypothetical protein